MPTAERRRTEAARLAQARKKAARAPQAPPPPPAPDPVEEVQANDEPDDAPEATPAEEARDPLAWRSPLEEPPFDMQDAAREPHGPFQLRLNGRGTDTEPGEIVTASWALGSTASGGRAWCWRTWDGRVFGPGAVEAWRPAR